MRAYFYFHIRLRVRCSLLRQKDWTMWLTQLRLLVYFVACLLRVQFSATNVTTLHLKARAIVQCVARPLP